MSLTVSFLFFFFIFIITPNLKRDTYQASSLDKQMLLYFFSKRKAGRNTKEQMLIKKMKRKKKGKIGKGKDGCFSIISQIFQYERLQH